MDIQMGIKATIILILILAIGLVCRVLIGMSTSESITTVAIIIGPVLAVMITRWQDGHAKKFDRKYSIFNSLMKTRQFTLDAEHVCALNLVELEFYGKEKIISAYRKYIEFRYEPLPTPDGDAQDRHFTRGENLLYDLLYEIGVELGFKYDKDDLKRFSYSPVGWHNDNLLQRKNASMLSELLEGKRTLPITSMQPQQDSPFPPPP